MPSVKQATVLHTRPASGIHLLCLLVIIMKCLCPRNVYLSLCSLPPAALCPIPNTKPPIQVKELIRTVRPEVVMVELCKDRVGLLVDEDPQGQATNLWHCRKVRGSWAIWAAWGQKGRERAV